MNNNINPDEVLTDAQLAALEASLSVITDVSRSDSDMAQQRKEICFQRGCA